MLQGAAAVLIALASWFALRAQSTPSPADSEAPPPATFSVTPMVNTYAGLRVSSITFNGLHEDEQVRRYLVDSLSQKIDEPLDRSRLQASIRELFASGRFSDIAVDAARGPNHDVAITFNVRENFFVGAVTVTGAPKRPPANQLINASKLQLGEPYDKEKIDLAMRSMKSVLADNGWYKAEVTRQENFNQNTQIVDVHFYVERNRQAKIGKVVVTGTPGYSEQEVRKIARLREGGTVTAERLTKALERLRKKYQKSDRLEAQVSLIERNFHADTNRLDYVFKIDRGPTVDLEVAGARLRRGLQKKYIPVFEENAVDDDLLNEGLRNLRDYYQVKGFFDVKVDYSKELDAKNDHLHVTYEVDRGERHKLVAINIDGNKYFDRSTILERISIRTVSGFLTHGRYSEGLLARDLQSIEALYKTNGFRDVKISHDVQDNVEGRTGDIGVNLHIDEGTQIVVNSLRVAGNESVPVDDLPTLSATEGQPYSDANVATDRDSVVNFYFNRGFPEVQFESAAQPVKGDPSRVDVVYTIKEGPQVYVDRVRVAGLSYTRPFVVDRELQIHDNDPLSQANMIETQKRLYDLGIFNEVDVAVQNPEGQSKYKDLLLEMREARRWTFTYGLGFEVQTGGAPQSVTELNTSPGPGVSVPDNSTPPTNTTLRTPDTAPVFSPRLSFDFTRLNFRGRDHTITFSSHISRLTQRALASYEAPRWFDRPNLRLTFTGLYDNSRDVRTFTAKRLEQSVQADQVLTRTASGAPLTTLLYRFQFRRVSVDANSLAISPALIPTLSRAVRVGIPSFTYVRDKRDDPLESHSGNYTTFDVGVAAKQVGSQTNFSRLLLQNSTYLPFRKRCSGGECTSWVFARSTRIGVAEPFSEGETVANPSDVTDSISVRNPIPLPERFFGGGGSSHRGFALNQAGPRDLTTGFPVGGNAVFVNSFELRTPPKELPWVGTNLNFVLFHDYGNVFESGQEMVKGLLRYRQQNRELCRVQASSQQCDFSYSAQALGLGARYRTPIGPVRVDLSYNLNPPEFPFFVQCAAIPTDSKGNPRTIHGLCGNVPGELHFPAGTQIFEHGTLRRINFFFSIGQTF